jgi:adenylate cyclase class IV
MRNIEAKFRCAEGGLGEVRERALAMGARSTDTLRQVDTYFHAARGRLKLRELTQVGHPARAVLIGYARADAAGARESTYEMAEIPDPTALLATLARTLDLRVRVEKTREVLLLRHTRIHLDVVRGLGAFVELETLMGDPDARRGPLAGVAESAEAERELREIAAGLGFAAADGLAGSYADLLEGGAWTDGAMGERHDA